MLLSSTGPIWSTVNACKEPTHQQSRSTRNSQPTMLPVPIVFDLVMHFFRKNGLTFASSRHAFPSNFFSVEDPGRTIVLPQTMSPRWRTCLRCHHQRLRPGRPVYGQTHAATVDLQHEQASNCEVQGRRSRIARAYVLPPISFGWQYFGGRP